jgi:lipoprotein-anchoring transpeptidase ErfK/SrfK
MNIMKAASAALLSAVLIAGAAAPTLAGSRVYNPLTNTWETPSAVAARNHGIKYSPIPRETVAYNTKYSAGTIVVETAERRLYFVLGNGEAIKYGIGVGRDGFRWSGTHRISRKAEWPGWTPPAEMRQRVPGLPTYMPGGINNPLGARALYIGSTLYRLHGTSEPWTIGHAVSSGCIRLTNDDIIDLYNRAKVGALVVVHQ